MQARRQWLLGALALSLAGCGVGTVLPSPVELDLGAPPTQATSSASWSLDSIVLPSFNQSKLLASDAVIWRQTIDGPPNRYATYRWSAAPANLVRERLFERLSVHGPVLTESINAEMPQLRVTLMQFEQVYAPDGQSNEALVTLQAVLVREGKVLGYFVGTQSQAAEANTAIAGAGALRLATDELLGRLMHWLSKELG